MSSELEIYDEVAYAYDGSLEGLLSAVFESYSSRERPADIAPENILQPRLMQYIRFIETDLHRARRVRDGLIRKGGYSAFAAVRKASVSAEPHAAMAAYRFIRYTMDEHKGKRRPFSNIAHEKVAPLYRICRSVEQECEHMRQFIRFEHLKDDDVDIWFSRCNPRDSVIPLVMDHFVERFNIQPFLIYDEAHHICGVYDGGDWYLVQEDLDAGLGAAFPAKSSEEAEMQHAWKSFYRTVAVDARYNPELRRNFMPKRFWKNLTEMRIDNPADEAICPG